MRWLKNTWILVLFSVQVVAQDFGNEWINYASTYCKIKVPVTGVYRIESTALAGLPILSQDPRNFQLFNKGKEVKIYIKGESDGVFDTNDYLEFYGEKNDAWLDTTLYYQNSDQTDTEYSLFNDTAIYFLTWNSSLTNQRITLETDIVFGAYTPIDNVFKDEFVNYNGEYYDGKKSSFAATDAKYCDSEGWFDHEIGAGKTINKLINVTNADINGADAIVNISIVGQSQDFTFGNNEDDHHLQIQFGNVTIDTTYKGYVATKFSRTIPTADLSEPTTQIAFKSIFDLGASADRNALASIQIIYPTTLDLNSNTSFEMIVPENPLESKSLLNMTNFANSGTVYIYNTTDNTRIETVVSGTNVSALVSNSGGDKECLVLSEGDIINVSSVKPATTTGKFTNYAATAIDSAYVIVTHSSIISSATAYATYRNSIAGGSHGTLVADIEELYDQHAYGIAKHPMSIRNFMNYLVNVWPNDPHYLFLVGKSISAHEIRTDPTAYAQVLVPTIGNPAADVMFTSGLNGTLFEPYIPTGRLSAKNSAEVDLYLNKIEEYETPQATPQEWMKNVLHFGGGTSATEQAQFSGYLNSYKQILEDPYFGGKVTAFLKTSTAPIQITSTEIIKNLINNGVSLMTFFGHGSTNGFDQGTDDVSTFSNKGKYPFILSNSCFNGNIHTNHTGSSEEYVLIADKGAIGYIAAVALGIPSDLNIYSQELIKNISNSMYGKPMGKIVKKTIEGIQVASNQRIKNICEIMTFHGDPAIIINSHLKPDYSVDITSVYTEPSVVTADLDSFELHVIIKNFGKAVDDTMFLEIERTYPDNGDQDLILVEVPSTHYIDTFSYKLVVDPQRGSGNNSFAVTVDKFGSIDELSETNNSTTFFLNILSSNITPIYPYDYAIVPSTDITFKASTADVFAASDSYIFELDTLPDFSSAYKKSSTVTGVGGLIKWTTTLISPDPDSTVYYWRVAHNSVDSAGLYNWSTRSLQYIQDRNGWSQQQVWQFVEDQYQLVQLDTSLAIPQFVFIDDIKVIDVQTGWVHSSTTNQYDELSYYINGSLQHIFSCTGGRGMSVAIFDTVTCDPVASVHIGGQIGQYGNKHCQPDRELYAFDYDLAAQSQIDAMENLINNVVTSGQKVLIYSTGMHFASGYQESFYQAFESLGAANIRTIGDTTPYIIYGTKDVIIGGAEEVVGANVYDLIQFQTTCETKWKEGSITSKRIGPAKSWGSVHWKQTNQDGGVPGDSIHLELIGVKIDGSETSLGSIFPSDSTDIYNLGSLIDVNTYPYMKLKVYMADETFRTPGHMDYWQVIYEGVPELALNPALGYSFKSDSLMAGDSLLVSIELENVSDTDMDSLLIRYWIVDENRNTVYVYETRVDSVLANSSLNVKISISTLELSGNNEFWFEANPDNDQLEQYHFNNILEVPFVVTVDNTNPLLDVTFDGIHILDGEIISSKPEIFIQLTDENLFMALDDMDDYAVYITDPSGTQSRIHFGNGPDSLQFTPAQLPDNSAIITYTPTFTMDGDYKILIQAKDASNNNAGAIDFSINFEVVNRSTITQVLNYPNPFTTATRFVFTLTGSEIPTTFRIQIISITGIVVKEIDQFEFGEIRIGRNMSDYVWDGTDMYGNRLANGVYFYHVITSINGNSIDHRETNADQFFTDGFGKMYLMR